MAFLLKHQIKHHIGHETCNAHILFVCFSRVSLLLQQLKNETTISCMDVNAIPLACQRLLLCLPVTLLLETNSKFTANSHVNTDLVRIVTTSMPKLSDNFQIRESCILSIRLLHSSKELQLTILRVFCEYSSVLRFLTSVAERCDDEETAVKAINLLADLKKVQVILFNVVHEIYDAFTLYKL